ncbi:phosphoadenosine phosphosulfate reductase [Pseudooceanicola sp. C21-150M6]|uniref:phosphoadenosine phosphosulfate reductase n=1 Tax=Pseudooceanicola sp. C21-150M6 TaxID=3434355 RepID=UPI003D7F7D1D
MTAAPPPADLSTIDLTGFDSASWREKLGEIAEEDGYYQPLDPRHFAAFLDRGPVLLVTFETMQGIRSLGEGARPLGWSLAQSEGWSHLLLACDGDTWFRHESIYRFFDRQVDDGFFEDFDRVVFFGTGPCGYAACAYSVAAPGSTVIAIQPQATLDPAVTEWDDRFADLRRMDFTSRYGYAPDMIDAADRAYLLYDPNETLDAMHVALFTRPNVTKLRLRYLGDGLQGKLMTMRRLLPLLRAAGRGDLSAATFAKLWRQRRNFLPYLRAVLNRLDADGRNDLAVRWCRGVTSIHNAPRFARRLRQTEDA